MVADIVFQLIQVVFQYSGAAIQMILRKGFRNWTMSEFQEIIDQQGVLCFLITIFVLLGGVYLYSLSSKFDVIP